MGISQNFDTLPRRVVDHVHVFLHRYMVSTTARKLFTDRFDYCMQEPIVFRGEEKLVFNFSHMARETLPM